MKALVLAALMLAVITDQGLAQAIEAFVWEKALRPEQVTIWRRDGWNLNVSSQQARATLTASPFKLAVLTFPKNSPLHMLLATDPRTQSLRIDGSRGMALISFKDVSEVAHFADLAHEGDFACGNAQIVNLKGRLTAVADHTAPVHDPVLALGNVSSLLNTHSFNQFETHIQELANLGTRHAQSTKKDDATAKVKTLFTNAAAGKIAGFTVTTVAHSDTSQKSVVAKIPGTAEADITVILGAHLDSQAPSTSHANAPGADDDASGVAALTEVIRAIADSGMTFKRSIEFHGYAAEELYLIGSDEIAQAYQDENRKVAAMMQFDMLAYGDNDIIHLVTNNTSATLRRGIKDLLSTYLGGKFVEGTLSAGTSDHQSWHTRGFPAVFPFESTTKYNPKIHTPNDTFANLNNTALAARFMKLGVAYLAHYAGLVDTGSISGGSDVSNDLKLAITAGHDAGTYHIAVSSAVEAASVELCKVSAGYCTSEITTAAYHSTKGSRYFYVNGDEAVSITGSEVWRVSAYDDTNQLIARRDVFLE